MYIYIVFYLAFPVNSCDLFNRIECIINPPCDYIIFTYLMNIYLWMIGTLPQPLLTSFQIRFFNSSIIPMLTSFQMRFFILLLYYTPVNFNCFFVFDWFTTPYSFSFSFPFVLSCTAFVDIIKILLINSTLQNDMYSIVILSTSYI